MKHSETTKILGNFGNLFDYVNWRGDLTFDASPFNVVDGLALSVLAYLNLPINSTDTSTTLKESVTMLQGFDDNPYEGIFIMRDNALSLAGQLAQSVRFKDIQLLDVTVTRDEILEKQFGAMACRLPDSSICIAYRGTDDTLLGWKEDFNMAFINGTPSQIEATEYAAKICARYEGAIRLIGHSKGGNLAIWAGAHLPDEYQPRLDHVYNYDGPGFLQEFVESARFQAIKDKTLSFIPASSFVGVLMSTCDYLTIKSDNTALLQHDPFSWRILGKRFDYDLERTKVGRTLEAAANRFISSMNQQEREQYVEQLFAMLKDSKVTTLEDLDKHKFRHLLFTLPKVVIHSV